MPLRPLGLGEIYDGAFRSIRHNPRVMFGLPTLVVSIGMVFGVALAYVLMPYLSGFFVSLFDGLDLSMSDTNDLADIYTSTFGALPGLLVVQFVTTTVLTGLLTASVSRSVIGKRISTSEVWSSYGRRALSLIPYTILLGLVTIVGWVLFLLPGAVLLFADQVALGTVLLLLGPTGAFVTQVWFSIRTLLVPPVIVLEGQGLWASVVRGWKLTRGSFWRLLGIYVLASIIMAVVQQIIALPLSIVGSILMATGSTFLYVLSTMLASGLGLILSLAFLAPVVALLYIDLRMRREGLDIELARAAEA